MKTRRRRRTAFSRAMSVCLLSMTVGIAIKGAAADGGSSRSSWRIVALCGVLAALAVVAAALLLLLKHRGRRRTDDGVTCSNMPQTGAEETGDAMETPQLPAVQIAKFHNIGRRSGQQDSLGVAGLSDGVLAVVADGMGGLASGDEVSQCVVASMLKEAVELAPGQMDGALGGMVQRVNEAVNALLGPERIYRSGSTMVAVLVRDGFFHWASVGDSRIYLYRGGRIFQLNQEHTYEVELNRMVMRGEITREEADNDPQKRGLTSFFGMGRLRYVDESAGPIRLEAGDRLLLMTDGVFNKLTDDTIAEIIKEDTEVEHIAIALEERVAALQDPLQDNFTALILGW